MGLKQPSLITVLSGKFSSQALAYAALRHRAARLDVEIDVKHVDVIREAPHVRLAHYFRPAVVARIQEMQNQDDTLILIRPSQLAITPGLTNTGKRLRLLGKFAGMLVEEPPDEISLASRQ